MKRRDFISAVTAAGLSAARPGAGRQGPAPGGTLYRAWSDAPGPDAAVGFEFGEPRLAASLATDASGMYAPHAFRGSDRSIYLGYYPWPDALESRPYPGALLRSLDDGVTWRSLGERPNFGTCFGETRDGAVWAIDCWKSDPRSAVFEAQRFTSPRHTPPEIVPVKVGGFGRGQEPFWHLNRFVRARDGSLATVTYAVTAGETQAMLDEKPLPAPTRIVCLASRDEARTWQLRGVVALDATPAAGQRPSRIGISEPYVEALGDGRLLCVYRCDTGGREMLQSWSSDSGRTWTAPVSAHAVGVDPGLLRLDNGVLLCSYGRPGVNLMYSLDGGESWRGHTSVYPHTSRTRPAPASGRMAAWSHAYTSMVALSGQDVLLFFDIHEHPVRFQGRLPDGESEAGHRTNSIFAVPIRVSRRLIIVPSSRSALARTRRLGAGLVACLRLDPARVTRAPVPSWRHSYR